MNEETSQFISDNINADVHQLALQSNRFPLVDMSLAMRQINGKQKIKAKVPLFFDNDEILYPLQLSLEQSSSESTARYKSSLCEGNIFVDLTGGFGVDCCFIAAHFTHAIYVERQAELCNLAKHNFNVLNQYNIEVIQAESEKYLKEMNHVDWIFVDPVRRSESGKKVVLLADCEPNVFALSSLLLEKATNVMIKLSPMLDLTAAISQLPNTTEIHVISIENECKEILFILNQNTTINHKIKTINITKSKISQYFEFDIDESKNTSIAYTSTLEKYLYEPNASIMKSGAFKIIADRFGIRKLHTSTHLYTSNKLLLQFPGRIFDVIKTWNNSKSELKELSNQVQKANITTRNYPISVNELRKKLRIKEGGDIYLFACTLANEMKAIIECVKYT